MNSKQLVTLILLVAVLGGAWYLLQNRQGAFNQGSGSTITGKKLMGDFPVNDVAHITVKEGTNELNLVKKDNFWRVRERSDYPANYPQLTEVLLKLQDLKVGQAETVSAAQLARLGLVAGNGTNAAVVVDFKNKDDKPIKSLLLGKKHMKKSDRPSPMGDPGEDAGGWPDGRYVKLSDSDSVAVISDALANIEPKPDQWLNKDFFKVEKVRSIAVTYPTATNSWKVSRETETGEWKLSDAKPTEQLDSAKTSAFGNALNSPNFSDITSSIKPEDLATNVVIQTFDDFTYNLKVGAKTNDNIPLVVAVSANIVKERAPVKDEKPEEKTKLDKEFQDKQKKLQEKLDQEKAYEKYTYLVSNWTLDSVLKDRSQLLAEKKEEPKKDETKADTSKADAPKSEAAAVTEVRPDESSTNSAAAKP